jgi:hypothetical protein
MKRKLMMSILATIFCGSIAAAAQTPNPVVTMNVTLPDGQAKELTAPESGLATVTLADGTEIGVRPTIQDSKPWSRVVVTFFKLPTASHSTQELGGVEVKTGGPVVQTKTTPSFKVAVTRVAPPETPAAAPAHSTSR